jgi:hypothetical protein
MGNTLGVGCPVRKAGGHPRSSCREDYRHFLEGVLHKINDRRRKRLRKEFEVMKPLEVALLPDYVEEKLHVTRWSTIQADRRFYSVPSRLIGETVRVRRYEDRIDVYLGGERQVSAPRLTGDRLHAINYRHVIEWLIRKPGAFARYSHFSTSRPGTRLNSRRLPVARRKPYARQVAANHES